MTDIAVEQPQPKRRWGRVMRRVLLWIVGVVATFLVIAWLWAQDDNYRRFTHDLTQFENVKIGAPMEEVRYALGPPKWVEGEQVKSTGPLSQYRIQYEVDATSGPTQMPKNSQVEQFNEWSWDQGDERIDVEFDPKTRQVTAVGCYVSDPKASPFSCEGVGGVSSGDAEDELVAKLGKPDRAEYDRFSPTKQTYYDAIGMEVYLTKREVYLIRKKAPQGAGFWWWLSHGRP